MKRNAKQESTVNHWTKSMSPVASWHLGLLLGILLLIAGGCFNKLPADTGDNTPQGVIEVEPGVFVTFPGITTTTTTTTTDPSTDPVNEPLDPTPSTTSPAPTSPGSDNGDPSTCSEGDSDCGTTTTTSTVTPSSDTPPSTSSDVPTPPQPKSCVDECQENERGCFEDGSMSWTCSSVRADGCRHKIYSLCHGGQVCDTFQCVDVSVSLRCTNDGSGVIETIWVDLNMSVNVVTCGAGESCVDYGDGDAQCETTDASDSGVVLF